MEELPDSVLSKILTYLPVENIAHCALVQRRFHECLQDDYIWQELTRENLHYSPADLRAEDGHWKEFFHSIRDRDFLYISQKEWKDNRKIAQWRGIEASSTDFDQNINRTIMKSSDLFWSSEGSDPNGKEYLIYQFRGWVHVKEIMLSAYKAWFMPGGPTYSANSIKISVGSKVGDYHFVSKEFLMDHHNQWQFFIVPGFVVGKVVRIDLIGKPERQASDNLYYHAFNYALASGTPLEDFKNLQLRSAVERWTAKKGLDLKEDVW
eukprot:CAMPEP_0114988344 /NCGR_PEP_ID=MMETSP0216-20121206/9544_1 /TAXON_ID=223996 /ORGANISM="Protocruzia adherens, Strain Boccale" /LENGTH=264 /DNA_ID=CAMNT_0002351109 /DNA_START=74 /DNA_END=865 /DNA_ORIENTATION=-